MACDGPFPAKNAVLKSGAEQFTENATPTGYTLRDFWRWSVSDLLSNAQRGVLAEFIVGQALDADLSQPRVEWDAYDLKTRKGVLIEVKSSSYLQSWHQEKLSRISFSIRKAKAWDARTGKSEIDPTRPADVYVFALLAHKDKNTVDPMKLEQWRFFVVSTKVLNKRERSQHSITLPSLQKIAPELKYSELRAEIESIAHG